MFKKIQPIYIVSILTAVVGFTGLFIANSFFGLNEETTMSIGVAIFAPVLAIIVGEYLRQRTEIQREEYETLKALVSFRHATGSLEYLGALNRVILVFDKNSEIKNLVKELWNGYVNLENPAVSKRRTIELIYAICKHMKRDITEFEIDSFFIQASQPAPQVRRPSPPLRRNPSSAASNTSNLLSITDSQSNYSITAGSFS